MEENNLQEIQHRLWSVEQDILDEIHRVCTEHGLRYSLAYGTLLGAVRHKGFIPWDDDVDVMMPREDYNQLLDIWNSAAQTGYLLQTEECSADYNNNFAKIRKDHTTFLQYEEQKNRLFHKGIYVDIFPMDRRASSWLSDKIQFFLFALNLLFNRGYSSGSGGVIGLGERVLLAVFPKSSYRKISAIAGRLSRKWNNMTNGDYVSNNTIEDCRVFFPSDIFENIEPIVFNGKEYFAVSGYDEVLSRKYGDYMKLPPENERHWTHHPVLIDFSHNIEELE